ncbi:MAG: SDR family NAD(P)-dependent oxidoreductase [Pirellulales bacterium]|nr:SDR family NAD(P)-dependent oxidoreductase [Pirellulales bacterium]
MHRNLETLPTYLVTGCAGFIGFHLCRKLLSNGATVVGIDNCNDYYAVKLKKDRLQLLASEKKFFFHQLDISAAADVANLFERQDFTRVFHLAAQAGVRYSLDHPQAYVNSNLAGFVNLLEGCRHNGVGHLVYASSSSVYGANEATPFRATDAVDHPISLYAATKRANELMAHTYSHLYQLPTTGLRFFTVFGPWGRPDMAFFRFTDAILNHRPIELYNHGRMRRDFTYIDDAIRAILCAAELLPQADPAPPQDRRPDMSTAPFRIFNVGSGSPIELIQLVAALEENLGISAHKLYKPLQPGDVLNTHADLGEFAKLTGFAPRVKFTEGVSRYVRWHLDYYYRGIRDDQDSADSSAAIGRIVQ